MNMSSNHYNISIYDNLYNHQFEEDSSQLGLITEIAKSSLNSSQKYKNKNALEHSLQHFIA